MAKRKKDDDQDELSERLARAGASMFSRSQQVFHYRCSRCNGAVTVNHQWQRKWWYNADKHKWEMSYLCNSCDINEILKMQAIDPSTGLPVGVTQEDFDKKNDDYHKNEGFRQEQ